MAPDTALEVLLAQAKAAHGEYERTELGGVYDEQWPAWYGRFLVAHGLAGLLGRELTSDQVADLLARSWAEQERTAPTETWEAFTAQRLAAEGSH